MQISRGRRLALAFWWLLAAGGSAAILAIILWYAPSGSRIAVILDPRVVAFTGLCVAQFLAGIVLATCVSIAEASSAFRRVATAVTGALVLWIAVAAALGFTVVLLLFLPSNVAVLFLLLRGYPVAPDERGTPASN